MRIGWFGLSVICSIMVVVTYAGAVFWDDYIIQSAFMVLFTLNLVVTILSWEKYFTSRDNRDIG